MAKKQQIEQNVAEIFAENITAVDLKLQAFQALESRLNFLST